MKIYCDGLLLINDIDVSSYCFFFVGFDGGLFDEIEVIPGEKVSLEGLVRKRFDIAFGN